MKALNESSLKSGSSRRNAQVPRAILAPRYSYRPPVRSADGGGDTPEDPNNDGFLRIKVVDCESGTETYLRVQGTVLAAAVETNVTIFSGCGGGDSGS